MKCDSRKFHSLSAVLLTCRVCTWHRHRVDVCCTVRQVTRLPQDTRHPSRVGTQFPACRGKCERGSPGAEWWHLISMGFGLLLELNVSLCGGFNVRCIECMTMENMQNVLAFYVTECNGKIVHVEFRSFILREFYRVISLICQNHSF